MRNRVIVDMWSLMNFVVLEKYHDERRKVKAERLK